MTVQTGVHKQVIFVFFMALVAAGLMAACSQDQGSAGADRGATPTAPDAAAATEPAKAPAKQPEPAAEPAADAAPTAPEVDLLHAVAATVTVSSAFRDSVDQASRLCDGEMETAWNSSSGDLQSAWISIQLPPDVTVNAIEMTSGYTKSATRDLFRGNYRVNRVQIFRDGESVAEHTLSATSRELQRLAVSGGGGLYRIDLVGMVPGEQASWREACISELRVLGTAPSTETGLTPTYRVATAEQVAAVNAARGTGGGDAGADGGGDGGAGLAAGDAGPPEPAGPPPAELTEADGLRVTKLNTCVGVEAGAVLDPRQTFSKAADERVYCYFRLANAESVATKVTLAWEQPGAAAPGRVREIDVPARGRFGSYAYVTTGHRSGPFQCVIRTEQGSVIGRIDFEITD